MGQEGGKEADHERQGDSEMNRAWGGDEQAGAGEEAQKEGSGDAAVQPRRTTLRNSRGVTCWEKSSRLRETVVRRPIVVMLSKSP